MARNKVEEDNSFDAFMWECRVFVLLCDVCVCVVRSGFVL